MRKQLVVWTSWRDMRMHTTLAAPYSFARKFQQRVFRFVLDGLDLLHTQNYCLPHVITQITHTCTIRPFSPH